MQVFFYESCAEKSNDRSCGRAVENGYCGHCRKEVEVEPKLLLKVRLTCVDGNSFIGTALGEIAEKLLGASAAQMDSLESKSMAEGDTRWVL